MSTGVYTERPVYSFSYPGWMSLREKKYKFHRWSPYSDNPNNPLPTHKKTLDTLFDIQKDPKEHLDLSTQHPDQLQKMRSDIEGWIQNRKKQSNKESKVPVNKILKEKLQRDGYWEHITKEP